MRTLHVGCMPFPTPQGTQALVGAMVRALRAEGHEAELLVYAAGKSAADPEWLHRLGDFPRVRSERSGPSLGKVALDLRMVAELRRRWRRNPCAVVAHNVEAALVARAAGVLPLVYVAHTRFDTELETYASERLAGPLRVAGAALDRLAAGVDAVGAVSPALAEHLGGTYLPSPWPERPEAGPPAEWVLYGGNLDGYQGWEHVVDACALADLPLLVATESDPAPLRERARQAGLARLELAPLRTDADREIAHTRCFAVAVPRRSPGGLPMKMLDALARDRPVVAMERALAGLAPEGVLTVANDDPAAFAEGLLRARSAPPAGGRDWLRSACTGSAFRTALESLLPK
jgi:glycosyltransferase involved in cell wall biosynthesis